MASPPHFQPFYCGFFGDEDQNSFRQFFPYYGIKNVSKNIASHRGGRHEGNKPGCWAGGGMSCIFGATIHKQLHSPSLTQRFFGNPLTIQAMQISPLVSRNQAPLQEPSGPPVHLDSLREPMLGGPARQLQWQCHLGDGRALVGGTSDGFGRGRERGRLLLDRGEVRFAELKKGAQKPFKKGSAANTIIFLQVRMRAIKKNAQMGNLLHRRTISRWSHTILQIFRHGTLLKT